MSSLIPPITHSLYYPSIAELEKNQPLSLNVHSYLYKETSMPPPFPRERISSVNRIKVGKLPPLDLFESLHLSDQNSNEPVRTEPTETREHLYQNESDIVQLLRSIYDEPEITEPSEIELPEKPATILSSDPFLDPSLMIIDPIEIPSAENHFECEEETFSPSTAGPMILLTPPAIPISADEPATLKASYSDDNYHYYSRLRSAVLFQEQNKMPYPKSEGHCKKRKGIEQDPKRQNKIQTHRSELERSIPIENPYEKDRISKDESRQHSYALRSRTKRSKITEKRRPTIRVNET